MKYDETLNKMVGNNKTGDILMKIRAHLQAEGPVEPKQE
jgi:hypothetical protein